MNVLQKILISLDFRVKIMGHVDRNRIHNYIYRYGIQDTEENFSKSGEVIKQRNFYIF